MTSRPALALCALLVACTADLPPIDPATQEAAVAAVQSHWRPRLAQPDEARFEFGRVERGSWVREGGKLTFEMRLPYMLEVDERRRLQRAYLTPDVRVGWVEEQDRRDPHSWRPLR